MTSKIWKEDRTFVFHFQESEFLKSALSLPWTLSTSQQPQQQMAGQHFSVTEPELTHMVGLFLPNGATI